MSLARRTALALLAGAALVVGAAPDAAAYVRTTATSGKGLYWGSGCVFVSAAVHGSPDVPGELEMPILAQVLANWETAVAGCGYLKLKYDGTSKDAEVGFDGENVMLFRQDRWCRPKTEDAPEKCYAPQAAGITTVFYVDKASDDDDGELLDADIELNGVNFRFAVDGMTDDATPGQIVADMENTLTHEVGHLIGLDHTCNDDPTMPTTDGDGNPVPTCNAGTLTGAQRDATMFAFQDDGEVKKSSIEADDVAGVCAAYPKADDPGQCKRVDLGGDGCGCRAGAETTTGNRGFVLILGLLGLLISRRRRN